MVSNSIASGGDKFWTGVPSRSWRIQISSTCNLWDITTVLVLMLIS